MISKHFDYLDSVRGIACMIVIIVHFSETMYSGIMFGTCKVESINYYDFLYYPPFGIFLAGHASVCLFFILSGFVLSYRFIGNCEIEKIAECIFKRPIRLFGMVYFSMIIVFIMSNRIADNWDGVLLQLIFSPAQANGVLWTIKIEFWGSVGTFLFCGITRNMSLKLRVVILFTLLIILKDTFYIAFVFGVLIADLYRNYSSEWFIKNKNLISWIIFIPAIIFFSYPSHIINSKRYLQNVVFVEGGYSMIGAMLMFVFIMCNDKCKTILNFKPLVFIGGISYSIYILHGLLIKYSHDSLFGYIGKYISTNHLVIYFVGIFIVFISTIIISYIVDKYVDKPCIKFSTQFAKNIVGEIQSTIKRPALNPSTAKNLLIQEQGSNLIDS